MSRPLLQTLPIFRPSCLRIIRAEKGRKEQSIAGGTRVYQQGLILIIRPFPLVNAFLLFAFYSHLKSCIHTCNQIISWQIQHGPKNRPILKFLERGCMRNQTREIIIGGNAEKIRNSSCFQKSVATLFAVYWSDTLSDGMQEQLSNYWVHKYWQLFYHVISSKTGRGECNCSLAI